jgi:hypothetical protein
MSFFKFFGERSPIKNIETKSELKKFTVEEVKNIVENAFKQLPQNFQVCINKSETYGRCATFSTSLRSVIEKKLPVKNAVSGVGSEGAGHVYLLLKGSSPEEDIIIDATITQFVKDYPGIFVGKRKELKIVVMNSEIINTRSRSNPAEAFIRIWGESSAVMG